jgi:hypothetical protein
VPKVRACFLFTSRPSGYGWNITFESGGQNDAN